MSDKVETQVDVKKTYGSYLLNKTVRVLPVESNGKWSTLLVKGEDRKKDPFIYNKVKRSFDCPLNSARRGGGIKRILDDTKRVLIKKYEREFPDGMTQQEFFEKELETNLNPSLFEEDNFWRTDRSKRHKVILKREGVSLNLTYSLDMLKYIILLANSEKVAPSYEAASNKATRRATFEWMIVDESKVTSKRVEQAELKAKAFEEFGKIISTTENMVGFIKSLGRTIPVSHTDDWLKSEVLKVLENSTTEFLSIVNDSHYDGKIFVQEACESGAIRRMSNKRYVLDNGIELGDLHDVINWMNDPENMETKLRIKSKIDISKR